MAGYGSRRMSLSCGLTCSLLERQAFSILPVCLEGTYHSQRRRPLFYETKAAEGENRLRMDLQTGILQMGLQTGKIWKLKI